MLPSICIFLYFGSHPDGVLAPLEKSFEGVLPVHAEIEVPVSHGSGHQYVSLSLCLPRQTVADIVFSSGKKIKVPGMNPSETQAEFFLLK